MKKIFTLLVAVGSITIASAQSGHKIIVNKTVTKDVSYGQARQSNGYDSYFFTERQRDAQIQQINREFDQKIAIVQRDRHLKAKQKTRQIKSLEKQRADQIKMVQQRYITSMKNSNVYSRNNSHKW